MAGNSYKIRKMKRKKIELSACIMTAEYFLTRFLPQLVKLRIGWVGLSAWKFISQACLTAINQKI